MNQYEELFTELFQKYYKKVYSYLLGKTSNTSIAEELLQETFLRVWKYIETLQEIDVNQQQSWIFKVSKNILVDYYRKNNTYSQLQQELIDNNQLLSSTNTYDKFLVNYELEKLNTIIEKLPEMERTIFHMSVIGDMASKEIGSILNIPAGTVRYKLHLIREKLKKKLAQSPGMGVIDK